MDQQALIKAIGLIKDPTLKLTLKEAKGIKQITFTEKDVVEVEILLKNKEADEEKVKRDIIRLVKVTHGFPGIKLKFFTSNFVKKGEKEIKYLAIASGKGGVGKSSVTGNLALAMSLLGIKVGVIDADIYGASMPLIFGLDSKPLEMTEEEKMIPHKYKNIEIISTEFFMPPEKPLMWRGPILGKMLEHYFKNVVWDKETELILIDLPPGTGDVAIDVQSYVPQSKVVVVTTPHINAASVAVKAGYGAEEIGHEVLGVIENMSYFINPGNQEKEYIFGQGGGMLVAQKLQTELLGSIPIGMPESQQNSLYEQNEIQAKFYLIIAQKIIGKIGL